ncbi:MAG: acireductone synthase [Myxococcales bacterium]|nr:acireductone synthase [Myxococcales bacterium]
MSTPERVIVLDIEGTTTSISFVYDAMFPFVRRELDRYLDAHEGEPPMTADVALLRAQAEEDVAAGLEGAVPIPEDGAEGLMEAVRASVLWQMDNDRKTTGLKSLQGKIWKAGFESGELKGHVFEDVPGRLEAWAGAGVPVYIYSSGSVSAQKLLFGYSEAGDLTRYLDGYFDTRIGSKKEADSYRAIADEIGVAPETITFVTDNLAEAVAAREAGVEAILSLRPGNPALPQDHGFPTVTSLTEVP